MVPVLFFFYVFQIWFVPVCSVLSVLYLSKTVGGIEVVVLAVLLVVVVVPVCLWWRWIFHGFLVGVCCVRLLYCFCWVSRSPTDLSGAVGVFWLWWCCGGGGW